MKEELHEKLLALLKPDPKSAVITEDLESKLRELIEFVWWAVESRSVADFIKERLTEIDQINRAAQALDELPEWIRGKYEPMKFELLDLASKLSGPPGAIELAPVGRGRHAEEKRVFVMRRCEAFLKENGKIATMHRTSSGAKFVQTLWLGLWREHVSLEAWAATWQRRKKEASSLAIDFTDPGPAPWNRG